MLVVDASRHAAIVKPTIRMSAVQPIHELCLDTQPSEQQSRNNELQGAVET